jgi:ABC-type multidrug transport system ATPase subunit
MIEISGLVKNFGQVRALDGLTFTCNPGEMIALVGPNGSGKSTALKIVAGVIGQDEGHVRIGGELMTMGSVKLRGRISYLPQRAAFPDQATTKEVLTFFSSIRSLDNGRTSHMMSAFGLRGFERKRVAELSGGMLQRLALAVSFLPEADLYVLDEATNNLDAEGLARFRENALGVLDKGASVILSTHILREVEHLANTIAMVFQGRIVMEKRIDKFVKDMSRSRKMWITMENLADKFRNLALEMGADKVILNCNTMTVECEERIRIPILSALSQNGAKITEFGLYEPSLADMYHQVFKNEGTGTSR